MTVGGKMADQLVPFRADRAGRLVGGVKIDFTEKIAVERNCFAPNKRQKGTSSQLMRRPGIGEFADGRKKV
jgi:hypothetical protein